MYLFISYILHVYRCIRQNIERERERERERDR